MDDTERTPLLATPAPEKTGRFVATIIPFLVLQASVGLCASLQATFYPIEAGLKGATAAQFGAVFGIIHLALFLVGKIVLYHWYNINILGMQGLW